MLGAAIHKRFPSISTKGETKTMKTGESIRKRITELREERGMTEYRMIRKSLLAPSTIKSVLRGKTRAPQTDTVTIICASLGVTVREFYDSPLFEAPDTAGGNSLERA